MIKEKLEKEATEYADGRGHEHYKRLIEENTGSPAGFAKFCFKDGYNKCKEELERGNEELKEKLEHRNCVDCSNHGSNIKLLKAKAIIKNILQTLKNDDFDFTFALKSKHPVLQEAEQFLKEDK